MNKYLAIFLLIAIGSASNAGQNKFIAIATDKGVYLRWDLDKKYEKKPISIYRKRKNRENPMLITEKPLIKARNEKEFKQLMGSDLELFKNYKMTNRPPQKKAA